MPNWCYNSLEISKKTEDGQKLIDAFVGGTPFKTLMPCPDELNIEAGFFGDGTEEQKRWMRFTPAIRKNMVFSIGMIGAGQTGA
jgi:hypothetical protein